MPQFDPEKPIILCRSMVPPETLTPGSVTTINAVPIRCCLCRKPLQITPHNIPRAQAGANTVCNSCGADLLRGLTQNPPQAGMEIEVSPEATEQVERLTGQCALDVFPNAEVRFVK